MKRQCFKRKRLNVGVIDLFARQPTNSLYARIMNPNFASIMPQVVAVWIEQMGHKVHYSMYTGFEDLPSEIPQDIDILFLSAFTRSAFLAYSISNLFRKRNVVTVLAGPHARAYGNDAKNYFDYVIGFADKALIEDLLKYFAPNPEEGILLSADRQPLSLPGIRERWKFIQQNLRKCRVLRIVPTIGSLGCPYKCNFCMDSQVDYQPLPYDQIREDLLFLGNVSKPPKVGWYDPNFGVRCNEYMDIIESTTKPGTLEFAAESTLSLLTESKLKRMKSCGFRVMLPGIESWFDFNQKSTQSKGFGRDKVREVADQVALVARYIQYVQVNFIFGLDSDMGPLPFELTKSFVDLVPEIYPNYQIITAYGNSTPLNQQYQNEERVIDIPFTFLDCHLVSNIRLKNYTPTEFYDCLIDLVKYSFSARLMWKRFKANHYILARWMNLLHSVSYEKYVTKTHVAIRDRYATDREFQAFYSGETTKPPSFYVHRVKAGMGSFYEYLPPKVLKYLEHGEGSPNCRISNAIMEKVQLKETEVFGREESREGLGQL